MSLVAARRRALLCTGPSLLLVSCAYAYAAGESVPGLGPLTPFPSVDYLLTLGPYGALVWGAYLLGKGVKFSIAIEVSEHDRKILDRIASALERRAPSEESNG